MKIKLKWKVDPAPTGPFKSFWKRGWPSAEYQNGECAAMIFCAKETEYKGSSRYEEGLSLKLKVAQWYTDANGNLTFRWRECKARYDSLDAAKKGAITVLAANLHCVHPEYLS